MPEGFSSDAYTNFGYGNDGVIKLKNEVDFSSWDPAAKTDMEALRNVFDTNHDGKLSSADTDCSLFKILVTNTDGTTTLKTMAEPGITSLNLRSNNQEADYSDGSKIAGTTTYTKQDSSTGKVADASFAYDPNGYLVTETVTQNADGSTTLVHVATRADGSVASKTTTTTSADGSSRTVTFDTNGDGVADRVQIPGPGGHPQGG